MMKERRFWKEVVGIIFMLLCFSSTILVYAEEMKTVGTIEVTVTSNLDSAIIQKPKTKIKGDGCTAESVKWDNEDFKEATPGDTISTRVTVTAKKGYMFLDNTPIEADGAQVSFKKISDTEARLTIRYEVEKRLLKPKFHRYEKGDSRISWDKVPEADEYQLSFFRKSDHQFWAKFTTRKTSFNLYDLRKEVSKADWKYEYYGELVAISDDPYLYESAIEKTTAKLFLSDISKSSAKDEEDTSGGPGSTQWQYRNGNWYYVSVRGEHLTGWREVGGRYYYMDPYQNGRMVTGWNYIDGNWYYFWGDGGMATNAWIKTNGIYYYVWGNGIMATNCWIQWNGRSYYVFGDGSMACNCYVGGFYVGPDGAWIP